MLTKEQKKNVELENKKNTDNIHHIKHRIVVFSGKGSVGKTTVSVNLANGLNINGNKTGILDADVTGLDIPKMTGISENLHIRKNKIFPQENNGVKIVSTANFLQPDQAVIWRGPMRSKVLNQFLGDVEWGTLDYLVADLPPGTGDEIVTITQKMEPDLAIFVTTPQEISLIDSARAIELFGAGGGEKQAKK